MIYNNCLFKVSDNSNVGHAKCFNLLENHVGSILHVSISKIISKGRYNKGSVLKGILIRKKRIDRQTGNFLHFDSNELILLNQKSEVVNTRIFGLIPLELRKKRLLKSLCLSSYFI